MHTVMTVIYLSFKRDRNINQVTDKSATCNHCWLGQNKIDCQEVPLRQCKTQHCLSDLCHTFGLVYS